MSTAHGVPFPVLCRIARLPVPVAEYKFLKGRKFAFDFAWVPQRVALECNGGVWIRGGGRHNRGKGYLRDLEKLNEAQIAGWIVLQVTPAALQSTTTHDWIRRALESRE